MNSQSAVDQSKFRRKRSNSRLKKRRYSLGNVVNLSDDEDLRSSPRLEAKKFAIEHQEANCSQDTEEIVKEPEAVPKKEEKIRLLPKDWCITRISTSKYTYKWTVENFSLLSCKTGEALSSLNFKIPQVANLECNLLLYPNGHDEKCKNFTCATLECLVEDGLDMDCELMMLNTSGNKLNNTNKTQPCNEKLSNSKTTYCVMTKNTLVSLLKNDVLVILCVFCMHEKIQKTSADNQYNAVELQNQSEVLSDLHAFIKEKDFCDVIICIEDQEFYAHRSILTARSSLFRKMFEHFTDKEIRTFRIDNIQSSVFQKMLHFIYTGKILDIESSASDLLEAACKFNLLDLKAMCERHLIENLSLDNVIQNLILAENQVAVDLKEKAKNFIVAYSSQIVDSPSFKLVRNLSCNLYQEILCLILNDNTM